MGVQADRDIEAGAKRRHECGRGRRPEEAGHVLDDQPVRAREDVLLGHAQVVVEGVGGLGGVEDVARVADGALGVPRLLAHRVDDGPGLLDAVQRIEHPEDVHAGRARLCHERGHDILRVRGVAEGVATADEHLGQGARRRGAQELEPRPGVVAEEPERCVERGTAPALEAEEAGEQRSLRSGSPDEVAGAHARGQQRLVRVAQGGVGDGDVVECAQPGRQRLRPVLVEHGLRGAQRAAGSRRLGREQGSGIAHHRSGLTVRPVDGGLGQPQEQAGCRSQRRPRLRGHELGMLVEEGRGQLAGQEVGVAQEGAQEADVGGDTAHLELRQRPTRAPGGAGEVGAARRQLDEQGVVERGDVGAGVRGSVEAHAGSAGGAVDHDRPRGRTEVVGGVLRGQSALDRAALDADALLRDAEVG